MKTYYAGIDIGSTMTKAVILDKGVIAAVIGPTGPEHRRLANNVMQAALDRAGISYDAVTYIIATGYGRINVPFADKQVTEISCHAKGVSHLFPDARTLIDIGGQDSKAIQLNANGKISNFIMNDKCAAGSGRFVEIIADALELKLEEMGPLSLESKVPANISSICTIWAQQEVTAAQAKGMPIADLIAGVHNSLADRVVRMAKRLKIEKEVILTGGGAMNIGLAKAISTYLGEEIQVPEEPLLTGALGAALLGRDICLKAAKSDSELETKERVLNEVVID
jgi:(R)-2-hydroxyacyl-CoA dehydratese activating ATPase